MARGKAESQPIIVLFEDDETIMDERKLQLANALPRSVRVVPFPNTALPKRKGVALEDRLATVLSSPDYSNGRIGLIICDRSLERYDVLQVASETLISAVAYRLSIPICLYERGDKTERWSLDQRRPWEKGGIIVDEESKQFGPECAVLYAGFQEIRRALMAIPSIDFDKMTPADVLARILGRPEETDRIALYGAGEQGMLTELLTFYDEQAGGIKALREKRYPCVLGYWLYTSILRFPGILVDLSACSSYLNIHPDDLIKPATARLFAEAKYKGPFADFRPWWWRRNLDAILSKAQCQTGLEYAKKKGIKRIRPCLCCEADGGHHPAGFHCMITEKPICEEHSRGGISWFPSGADLARVSEREYKKIGPFLGLY
jgi:hypothetical protein